MGRKLQLDSAIAADIQTVKGNETAYKTYRFPQIGRAHV